MVSNSLLLWQLHMAEKGYEHHLIVKMDALSGVKTYRWLTSVNLAVLLGADHEIGVNGLKRPGNLEL